MITLISAAQQHIEDMVPHEDISDILVDSVVNNTTLIDEIILIYQDGRESIDDDMIKVFNIPDYGSLRNHSESLYHGIQRAKNNYILFSDIDCFYLADCPKIWMNLMNTYQLSYIGVQNYQVPNPIYGYFPSVINLLTHKLFLPKVWTDGGYDIGVSLYNECSRMEYKWLSFAPFGLNLYNARYEVRTNFSFRGIIEQPNTHLLYHHTSQNPGPDMYKNFRKEYEIRKVNQIGD